MLAYRQCNATTDLGADTLTDADKRRDLRRTKRRLAIRQQRQRRRDARNRLYATIPEEERGAFIKNEKALREENHKRMLQHLEACYTRSDPSSCYRICFNCSFADTMSNRETASFLTQLSYAYCSLKRNTDVKMQYHISSLKAKDADLVSPWANYDISTWKVHCHAEPYWEIFSHESLVVLSPDAQEELTELDATKVYVIGGLVDRTILKNYSWSQAQDLGLTVRKLSLKSYAPALTNPVLNINTVVDIIREYIRTSDWAYSFVHHIPQRKVGTAGPRAARKQRYNEKVSKIEAAETCALEALKGIFRGTFTRAVEGCHSLNNGDHVGGTSDYVFQLDQETVDALRYMESYFTFKNNKLRVKAARANHDVVKIPPSIPSAGCVCRDDLLQWHVLLSQRREMRLRRREKEDDYGRVAVWNEEESFFNSSTSNNNAAAATESLLGILIHEL